MFYAFFVLMSGIQVGLTRREKNISNCIDAKRQDKKRKCEKPVDTYIEAKMYIFRVFFFLLYNVLGRLFALSE